MGKISSAEVLRLRATSAVSRDKSVRRCAQEDVFAASWRRKKPDGKRDSSGNFQSSPFDKLRAGSTGLDFVMVVLRESPIRSQVFGTRKESGQSRL